MIPFYPIFQQITLFPQTLLFVLFKNKLLKPLISNYKCFFNNVKKH